MTENPETKAKELVEKYLNNFKEPFGFEKKDAIKAAKILVNEIIFELEELNKDEHVPDYLIKEWNDVFVELNLMGSEWNTKGT